MRPGVTIVLWDRDDGRVGVSVTFDPAVEWRALGKRKRRTLVTGAQACGLAAVDAVNAWKAENDPEEAGR